jgi:acyl-CoA synthetase (AMP-forming)/AMP-acid ligase II
MQIDVESLFGRRAVNRWERTSIGDLFERVRWSTPDKEAIVARQGAFANPDRERITYARADDLATRVANALLARGLQRGDRVLMFCDNSVEAYVAKIGIAKAGLVCAPLNAMVAPDVIAYLIERIEPRLAIVDAELWPKAQQAFEQTGIRADVTIEIGGGVVDGGVSFDDFVAGASTDEPDVEIHGDDIWELICTSGTTAMPKAVMLSHNYSHLAGYNFALTLSRGLHIEDELRLCAFLPLVFHVADQIFSFPAFLSGGTLIMGRRPDAAAIAQAISDERATALWAGSPAMLQQLADALAADPSLDATALTIAVFGWAALPPSTLAALRERIGQRFQVCEILGQTESISCHRFWPDRWSELYERVAPAQNYVGYTNPLLASRIVDPFGEPLPPEPGLLGEVVYRSPVTTAGYYRDEEATRTAFRSGWFHSGDSCALGEDGLRVMLDRVKDIVKSGGENVSSLRVEAVLHQHPDVEKAAVVGLAHEKWGEAVTAFVIPADGASLDIDAVTAFCRERLAGFESPKRVVVVDELPVTVGGKVLKHKLRAEHGGLYDGER